MKVHENDLLGGRYKIENLIGQGGMSYVYKACDEKMGRTVAIKVLKEEFSNDDEFVSKFRYEARAAAKLNHPNIVTAYDVVDDGDIHYIVMELVEGITLKEYIKNKGALDNDEAIYIAIQVMSGIEHAHKMGIVHRDIKPQNMIVAEDGLVKVADFGIARVATEETINATVIGSVHYISPEQARNGIADEKSDIYSFGCTVFEMLTATLPYNGESSVAVVISHLQDDVPKVSDIKPSVYPALDKIVYKCMQKKPEKRYLSATKLLEDLEKVKKDIHGSFIDEEKEKENLDETRIISKSEIDRIKTVKKKNPKDEMALTGKIDINNKGEKLAEKSRKISANLNIIYKIIAGLSFAFIIAIFIILGKNIFSGDKIDNEFKESISSSDSKAASKTNLGKEISISDLDEKLKSIPGMYIDEAEKYLTDYNLKVMKKDEVYSDTYREGCIVSYPEKGYKNGDTVYVDISKGRKTMDFSDIELLNKTSISSIKVELEEREIPYSIDMQVSDTVVAGNIIKTNKKNTDEPGRLVLTVSEGNKEQSFKAPNLIGYIEDDAEDIIKTSGYIVGDVRYAANPAPEGTVFNQSPEADTFLEKNSPISLDVSSGPDGDAYIVESNGDVDAPSWRGNINTTFVIPGSGPGIEENLIIEIRLKQEFESEFRYSTIQNARSYKSGTELPIVFGNIKGIAGVSSGIVEVVDLTDGKDQVIGSFPCKFEP